MKLKTNLLASAIAVAATLGGMSTANSAEPPSWTTIEYGVGPTSAATISGGVTINDGVNFLTQIPNSLSSDFIGTIVVDPEDVGKTADIIMVIRTQDTVNGTNWYQKEPDGSYVPWNYPFVVDLAPFETRTLSATETVTEENITAPGDNLEGMNIAVFYGYRAGDKMIYNNSFIPATINAPLTSCPTGTTALDSDTCTIPGGGINDPFTSDLHLTADFDYVTDGAVFIGGDNTNSATMTIDPGVTIYGGSPTDIISISRGSKIAVNGTESAPVVMTAATDADADTFTRGEWGGLIINGNAHNNKCSDASNCDVAAEGDAGVFGGNDDEDNSGNLNYLIVKYAGFLFSPDNELNGIAFQSVGSGTLVDYVQIHNGQDDAVEFYGGTVTAKHLVITGTRDDGIDWTDGWTGKIQHAVVISKTDDAGNAIESDNLEGDNDALPRSHPTLSNITFVGTEETASVLFRRGTAGNFSNFVISDLLNGGCLDIDSDATFASAGTSATDLTGELTMVSSIIDCGSASSFVTDDDDVFSVEEWFLGQDGNSVGTIGIHAPDYINTASVNGITPTIPDDPFFDEVDYIGAVKDSASDWLIDWVFWDFE